MTTHNPRRVQLACAYVLHHRPYRDSSRILEVLSREFGRMSLFARGVRGPKARFATQLQPFQPLLLSWSGRGEAPQLTGAEPGGEPVTLPAGQLMAAFYLNELLLKLTHRHDPQPAVFDLYHGTLAGLKGGAPLEPTLRIFEKRLLETLGYGLDLIAEEHGGDRLEPLSYYHFRPSQGLARTAADAPGAVAGSSVIALAHERLASERELEDARRLLQPALAHCLEGRELKTRSIARSIARRESRQC